MILSGVAAFFAEDSSLKVNDAAPAIGLAAIAEIAQASSAIFRLWS
jgi:hypothetical protein